MFHCIFLGAGQLDHPFHQLVVPAAPDGTGRFGVVISVAHPRVAQRDVQQVKDGELRGELKVERVPKSDVDVEPRGEGWEDGHGVRDVLFLVLSHRLGLLRVHGLEVGTLD